MAFNYSSRTVRPSDQAVGCQPANHGQPTGQPAINHGQPVNRAPAAGWPAGRRHPSPATRQSTGVNPNLGLNRRSVRRIPRRLKLNLAIFPMILRPVRVPQRPIRCFVRSGASRQTAAIPSVSRAFCKTQISAFRLIPRVSAELKVGAGRPSCRWRQGSVFA